MKDDLILLAMALLVTLGSALLFSVRPKLVPFAVLGGVIGAGFYILCIELTSSHFFSNFAGAFAVTAYSEFCAIKLRAPAAIFLMPGNIPLVPGGGLFYTMKAIITQNGEELRVQGSKTAFTALGLACGVMVASMIFNYVRKLITHSVSRVDE